MAGRASDFWEVRKDDLFTLGSQVKSNTNPDGTLSWADVGKRLGVSGNAARMKFYELRDGSITEDVGTPIEGPIGKRVKTLDDLIRECKIDLTTWKIERWVANKWEVGARHPKTGAILTEPLYQVKAWLRPCRDAALQRRLWDEFLADVKAKASPGKPAKHAAVKPAEGHLLEVALFDVHFGKLAWEPETGESYDISIARQCFRHAVTDLLKKASGFPIDECLFVVGNDGMHFDNFQQTTTGGTFQDSDTRYAKMFTAYWRECLLAIEQLKQVAPVTVLVVPGNHDKQSAYCIGEVLAAWFEGAKDPQVTVNNTPTDRKYHRYGVTLLGFTHGNEEKHDRLPMLMASERRAEWAATQHHEWHTGHVHKAKETKYVAGDSMDGVRVRILPSLAAHDAWHVRKGYSVERRAAEAYLFHRTTGYTGHFSSNILAEVAT